MTFRFVDKFTRADGDIGDAYLQACGGVIITDQAVVPIDSDDVVSGVSPIFPAGVTARKTQVLYNAEALDDSDQVVRITWAHDEEEASTILSGTTDPSITILARMEKDPVLFDLGVDEEPLCYDQGYGVRVTMPRSGAAPTMKIVKFMPSVRIPGVPRPSSTEVDGAVVLASHTLASDEMNLDPTWDGTGDFPYRGYWQDMRLRIRRSDSEVILEVFLNDRNLNQPILSFTDRRDPLWGAVGLPGFEFLSATLPVAEQPEGTSPFSLSGLSLLRVGIFSAETVKDLIRPTRAHPGNQWTYDRVTNRVITLVEKNGDSAYNSTTAGTTKAETYRNFVLEAEAEIIRSEGYWDWLKRSARIYLVDGQDSYELPADHGLTQMVRPGNWNRGPLSRMESWVFHQRIAGIQNSGTGGNPTIYTDGDTGVDDRPMIKIFPVPAVAQVTTSGPDEAEDPFLLVEYFARQLIPDDPESQIPFIPQQHIDVLVYMAAAHAALLDTDDANAQRLAQVAGGKKRELVRANNRNLDKYPSLRAAADVIVPSSRSRIPLLRNSQLEQLLI